MPVLNNDGSRLAIVLRTDDEVSGNHEHLLMVVETATGREVVRQTLKNNPSYNVQFSPNGRRLGAIVSPHEAEEKYGPADALLIWDAEIGGRDPNHPGHVPAGMDQGLRSVPTAVTWRP